MTLTYSDDRPWIVSERNSETSKAHIPQWKRLASWERKPTKWLIFGGAGFLGKALIEDLLDGRFENEVTVASRDEAKHLALRERFPGVETRLCDIRDRVAVSRIIKKTEPHYIVIASALKQIDLCEREPGECVATNVQGLTNVLEEAQEQGVSNVVFVSTDKACDPVNVYGSSKCLGERIAISERYNKYAQSIAVVRYGNVFGSTGSIFPLINGWKERKEPFRITDRQMTRFLMTVQDAVEAIHTALESRRFSGGTGAGGIYIPILRSHKVQDLMEILGGPDQEITEVGIRPGEKIHETLLSASEARRARPIFTGQQTKIDLSWSQDPGLTLKGFLYNPKFESRAAMAWEMTSGGFDEMSKEHLQKWLSEKGFSV